MHSVKKIGDKLYYVGASDRRLSLFENVYPIPEGVSYNSYLYTGEKTVLFDCVDSSVARQFIDNVQYVLEGREVDYLIVNHMEPDHCATIEEIVLRYPKVKIIGNQKTFAIMKQFYEFDVDSRMVVVKDKETLEVGELSLTFYMAPMVHWPEVMMTYENNTHALFSADAFGTFGALSGNLYADEVRFDRDWLDDARRYYTNIVGKYGMQVQNVFKKLQDVEIDTIYPLHGPIWRDKIDYILGKYILWSTYQPEDDVVLIAYASIYGNTQSAVSYVAKKLEEKGEQNIVMYDVSVTDPSYILSEAFRCSRIIFASPTYNAGIFPKMETLLLEIKAHNLQNRKVAVIENGSWAISAGKQMVEIISQMKNMEIYDKIFTIKSSLKENQLEELNALVDFIAK